MPAVLQNDDEAFMSSLLDGVDESFFSSPVLTPARPGKSARSAKGVFPSSPLAMKEGAISRRPSRPSVKSSGCGRRCGSRCDNGQSNASPSSENIDPHATELKAIEDLIKTDGGCFSDLDPFSSPPQKRQRRVLSRRSRSPLKEVKNGGASLRTASSARPSTTADRYVRCRVDSVEQGTYIPQRYLDAPEGYHSTRGVKPATVRGAMERRQTVLGMTQLHKKGEQVGSCELNCIAFLRDDWLRTIVKAGDIVHLIGHWSTNTESSPARVEVALEDNDGQGSDQMSSSKSWPTIVLSSETALDPLTGRSESENMLVLHPDTLLSATAISSAVISCSRKSVLQSKIRASGPGPDEKPTEALIMGRMLHEVLQSCLTGSATRSEIVDRTTYDALIGQQTFQAESTYPALWFGPASTNFSDDYVKQQVISQVYNSLEDILHVGLETREAVEKLWVATLPFGSFASTYLNCPHGTQAGTAANAKAEVIDPRSSSPPLVRVVQIHDVEEDIWSPMYGLKGFVDVSVEVELTDKGTGKEDFTKRRRRIMMPLELKTGRSINIAEHRAQTMLYTLMMSDRYSRTIDCGLLYYSKGSEMHLVRTVDHEMRGLMQARNELASYMVRAKAKEVSTHADVKSEPMLPPTIDNERTCSRCYVAESCMLYRRAIDAADDEEDALEGLEPSSLLDLSNKHTSHLTPRHLSFFRHFDGLLAFEDSDVTQYRSEMWTMTADVRERLGRCYADMVMEENVSQADVRASQAVRMTSNMNQCHIYRFKKAAWLNVDGGDQATQLGGNFATGDAVCLSIEPALLSIAQGFILTLTPQSIVVAVDKKLEEVLERADVTGPCVFRVDKEEQVSGMARIRYNLAKLFFASPAGDVRRRDLIVDLHAPRFRCLDGRRGASDLTVGLNEDQGAAIEKSLCAEDYALIVGMPGTGKTTTIARLIALLARRGQSVLLTSYTHSAVDTICRKLLEFQSDVRLLRLGSSDRIHADIRPFTSKQAQSAEHLREQLLSPNVVATTCLSIGHALFALRTFDYCIVDEASQITLPACLGPLRYARTFVLVGDPQQLPPLVKDSRAREGGLDVSLFERLQRAHPSSVAHLCHQYRMNEDIMALSNALTYDDMLLCGDARVSKQVVDVPDLQQAMNFIHTENLASNCSIQHPDCWLTHAVLPSNRALFVDTDSMCAFEQRSGELVENLVEARLIVQLIVALTASGIDASDIAVITPYRQQIRRLSEMLKRARHPTFPVNDLSSVEVWTADKSQGRDKDVVIVSFVRSTPPSSEDDDDDHDSYTSHNIHNIGRLLHDVRRINVTLTRAKKKLILIGSRQTLVHVPLLHKLWTFMQRRRWTISPSLSQRDAHSLSNHDDQD